MVTRRENLVKNQKGNNMSKYQTLRSIVAVAVTMETWPKQAGGKPYPCSVQNIDTANGQVPVIKLDDLFFGKNGGNQQVMDQLKAQLCLTSAAMKHDGVRVSTFYKAKDGTPRPGFQVSIPGTISESQNIPTKSVDDRLAEAWASVMDRLSDEEVEKLAEALDGKATAFALAKLERALAAAPKEEGTEGTEEDIPF